MRTHKQISMVRATLQSAVCCCVAPLLLAQQVTDGNTPAMRAEQPRSVTRSEPAAKLVPKGTGIDFVLLEPLSSATTVKGQKVRLAVSKDVAVKGVIAIPRGTPAEGVVSDVRKAKPGKRDGEIMFRPVRLLLSDGSGVKIGEYPPGKDSCGPKGSCLLLIPVAVPLVFFFWPDLVQSAWQDHKIRHRGIDKQVDACMPSHGYTAKNLAIVPTEDSKTKDAESAANLEVICPAKPPSTQNDAGESPASSAETAPEMR